MAEQRRIRKLHFTPELLGLLLAVTMSAQPTLASGAPAHGVHELTADSRIEHRAPVRLAIFPFSVAPVNEENAYLRHALADAISDQLVMTPGLQLIARQSVQAVHDAGLTRATSGRILDADFILEGEIRPGPDSVAIELRLWNSAMKRNEWVMQVHTGGSVLQQLPLQVAQRVRDSLARQH